MTILAIMLFLIPAFGVPTELVIQDSVKSAIGSLFTIAAALAFFWQGRAEPLTLRWHGLMWLPIALMVYALGSATWSHTYLALVEAVRWFVLGLLLFVGINCIRLENIHRILWGIHLGAVVAGFMAAMQFWLGWDAIPQFAAPAATFVNRNFMSEYLVTALPFSVWLIAMQPPERFGRTVALTASFVFIPLAILMAGTRSALLALALLLPALVFVLLRHRKQLPFAQWSRKHRLAIGMLFTALLLALAAIPCGNEQILQEGRGASALQRGAVRAASATDAKEYTEGSVAVRTFMWKSTIRMIQAHPWAGVGAGAWEVYIPLFQGNFNSLEVDYFAHNEYLQLLAEYGLPVGGLWLAVLFAYLLHTFLNAKKFKTAAKDWALLQEFALCAMVILLVVSAAGFPLHLAGVGALFMLTLSLFAVSDRFNAEESRFFGYEFDISSGSNTFVLVSCIFAVSFWGVCTIQALRAESHIVTAIHLENVALKDHDRSAQTVEKIFTSLHEGLSINPNYRQIGALAADHLATMGDFPGAIWALETIAKSRPNVPDIWFNLLILYSYTSQFEAARAALEKLDQLQPNSMRSQKAEVIMLWRFGEHDVARAKLKKLIIANQQNTDWLQFALQFATDIDDKKLANEVQGLMANEFSIREH